MPNSDLPYPALGGSEIPTWHPSPSQADHLYAELNAARAEILRLQRGDFTPEEFQALCHHRDEKPGCTLPHFAVGCREYQGKLFGAEKVAEMETAKVRALTSQVEKLQRESVKLLDEIERLRMLNRHWRAVGPASS